MQFRRYPVRSRVADAWFRSARDSKSDKSLVDRFLEEMGDRKVRAPGRDKDVQLSTLRSSSKPEDQAIFQRELDKWSGGVDTEEGDGKPTPIGTPDKLKAVQDDLVERAVEFGVSEDEARGMVKGLTVDDTDDDIIAVEKNLERAMDKVKKKKDDDTAKAKEETDRAKAEADEAAAKLAELDAKKDKLVEKAVKSGVSEEKAREMVEGLTVDSTDDDIRAAKKNLDRQGILDRATAANQAIETAKTAIEDAKEALAAAKKSKDKDYVADPDDDTKPKDRKDAIEKAKANLAKAKSDLLKAEDTQYWASVEHDRVMDKERDEVLAGLRTEATRAREDLISAVDAFDEAKAKYDAAYESGDAETLARAEADVVAADDRARELWEKDKAVQQRLSETEAAGSVDKRKKSEEAFNKARERHSKGMVLFNEKGDMVHYDPSTTDKIYEAMMTLLGEQLTKRPLPEIEGSRGFGGPKLDTDGDGIPDVDDTEPKVKGKGKGVSGPTKSGKPRNSDGSSPTGGETVEYGAHEFWMVNPDMWSAKNGKGVHRTFPTKDGAKAYAKTASSMTSRVASRYLNRYNP